MKIVTWNCNGAFRNKFEQLSELDAYVNIIQECENPKYSKHQNYIEWAGTYLWSGDNKNKGIGVFAKNQNKLRLINWSNIYNGSQVKHFIPCLINNKFQLLCILDKSK